MSAALTKYFMPLSLGWGNASRNPVMTSQSWKEPLLNFNLWCVWWPWGDLLRCAIGNPVIGLNFPIKKRINTELFIHGKGAFCLDQRTVKKGSKLEAGIKQLASFDHLLPGHLLGWKTMRNYVWKWKMAIQTSLK